MNSIHYLTDKLIQEGIITVSNYNKVKEFIEEAESLQRQEVQKYVDFLRDIDKSLYLGDDLNDGDVLKFYVDVISTIKEEIKELLKDKKYKIYLDDVRTPVDNGWTVVRNYDDFVSKVDEIGLENIECISLDHDLGESSMKEWHKNVYKSYTLNYDNITEKTGYDCAKWLVEQWLNGKTVVDVYTHSANAIGSANIMGYINNYRHIHKLPQNCIRVQIKHTV